MLQSDAIHNNLLGVLSEGMLRYTQRDKFLTWIANYVVQQLRASHVSLAVYDSERNDYPIRCSGGPRKFPSALLTLDQESFILRWFQEPEQKEGFTRRSDRFILREHLSEFSHPYAIYLMKEMDRHHISACIKIQNQQRIVGLLLIGPREDNQPYSPADLSLFQTLANHMALDIEKEEYCNTATKDPLTGLYNRALLDEKFNAYMQAVKGAGEEFAAVLVDIDHFKKINDTFGHLFGDEILRITSELLQHSIRHEDTIFRYGGEEFLILFAKTSRDPNRKIDSGEFHYEIYRVLDRLRMAVEMRAFQCINQRVSVTMSFGLTFYQDGSRKTPQELIHEADQALYHSKNNGRNLISVFPYI